MRPVSLIAPLLAAAGLLITALLPACNAACDGDGDGFCLPDDCDDNDPLVNPDAPEQCNGIDDNCNGGIAAFEREDDDGDGTADCFDCAPGDATTFPGATEICDERDNDCDGQLGAIELDEDGDGYRGCDECDDSDAGIFPGSTEVCDGADTDCDGVLPPTETDQDDDGFLECNGDCNPNNEDVFPGAEEVCDGQDSDCDGELPLDEATDADNDNHVACLDCDDTDFNVSPDAEEVCDGVDNNCDGEPYLDPETLDPMEKDDDEDGFLDCGGDCDDQDPEVNPAAFEILDNTLDDDCNGTADDFPGWTPYSDPEGQMLAQRDGQCSTHNQVPMDQEFDAGVGVVGTSLPNLEFEAELGGVPVDVVFASAVAPYAGTGYIATDGPVDSLTVLFDVLQDFVVFAITPENPAASLDYSIEIFQYGTSLIDGPTFGAPATAGWNLRAAASHWALGYDQMVFHPATSGEVILLDAFSFCN